MENKRYTKIAVMITANDGKHMTDNAKEILINSFNSIAKALNMSDLLSASVEESSCVELSNPHAELIAQCEQDKKQFPCFWWELWQWWKGMYQTWATFPDNTHELLEQGLYRQHPHRDSIIEWHKCSDVDKLRWQWKDNTILEWQNHDFAEPSWDEKIKYRICPRTCSITLQDGIKLEYPEPRREKLDKGCVYWYVQPTGVFYDRWLSWSYKVDKERLYSGSIHLTEQDAKQHLAVMQAVNSQVAISSRHY